jgi:hypothetical protein
MAFSPTSVPSSSSAATPGAFANRRVEIVTIPEKFYGVALGMEGKTQAEREVPSPPPPVPKPISPQIMVKPAERKPIWPYLLLVGVVVLVVSGVFVFVNKDLLFPAQAPAPVPAVVPPAPSAPSNLSATTSGLAVSLMWVDGGGVVAGVRIERQENGSYAPLTVLPAGSTAFLDVSAQPSRTYAYHVIAFGEGGESSPSNEVTVRVPDPLPPPPPLPVAPVLPSGGLDSDSDGLTDVEEPLYGTDARSPDADLDGFLDGNEVFHLYNPAARSPVRLLDSGLVKLFSAPAGWSILVPASWIIGLDIPDGSQATVTTGRGETMVLKIENNATGASLTDWYVARTPGESASSVRPFITKEGLQGVAVSDRLEAFFAWGGKVFTVKYILGGESFINYRTTFEMMLNSLKLVGVPIVAAPSETATGPGSLTKDTPTVTSSVSSTTSIAPPSTASSSASLIEVGSSTSSLSVSSTRF